MAAIFGEADRELSAVLIRHCCGVLKSSDGLRVCRDRYIKGCLHLPLRVPAEKLLVV